MTLTWWSVFESEQEVRPLIDAFHAQHPNVTIEFRKFRFEEYEEELLNALAEDRGPDIFSVHNTWVGKYESKLAPLPRTITLPYQFVRGTIKKEVVTELRSERGLAPHDVRSQFVDVVASDAVRTVFEPGTPPAEAVLGLPLSVDTLVMFANRDLLNAGRIPEPATTWNDFQEHVRRITRIEGDRILQSGTALGTSTNVPRATDILSLLMMQNGTIMTDDGGYARFDQVPPGVVREIPPGEEALRFYTDFANPVKEVYAWNETMPDAFTLFLEGRLGYFFGYAYHLPLIRSRAPKLRLAVAPVPQIAGNPEVHFANYWVEGVSKKSTNAETAWGFIQFMTGADQARAYLAAAARPPARRSLIAEAAENPDVAPFANQLLTAQSWYRGKNAPAAEKIMRELIDVVSRNESLPFEALRFAVGRINQTIR